MRHLACVLCVLLLGCAASIDSVSDHPYFAGVLDRPLEIQQESRLIRRSERLYEPDATHWLDVQSSGSPFVANRDINVPIGTTVTLESINRYHVDTRGAWIGAVGVAQVQDVGAIRFIYSWSRRNVTHLDSAPWEKAQQTKSAQQLERALGTLLEGYK